MSGQSSGGPNLQMQRNENLQYKEKQVVSVGKNNLGGATSTGPAEISAASKVARPAIGEQDVTMLQCFRCWNHGKHVTKDCKEEISCTVCSKKESHISSKYAWLHQKKPLATLWALAARDWAALSHNIPKKLRRLKTKQWRW